MRPILLLFILIVCSFGNTFNLMPLLKNNSTLFVGYSYYNGNNSWGTYPFYSNDLNIGVGILSFNKHVDFSGSIGFPISTNTNFSVNSSSSYIYTKDNELNPIYNDTVIYDTSFSSFKGHRWFSINEGLTLSFSNFLVNFSTIFVFTIENIISRDSSTTYSRINDGLYYSYHRNWDEIKYNGNYLDASFSAGLGYRYKRIELVLSGFWGDFNGFSIKSNYHFW